MKIMMTCKISVGFCGHKMLITMMILNENKYNNDNDNDDDLEDYGRVW